MKEIKDNFSKQSETYKKFRPEYPEELYKVILTHSKNRESCWDCGTGNGQVAKELSKNFKNVFATDISENQLKLAYKKPNISYSISRAEKTPFNDNQFDIITVAQAIHWFHFNSFYKEAKRVGKPNSKIFVIGYGLLKINPRIDKIITKFYTEIIGAYWDKERRHIDNKYNSIEFGFEEIPAPKNLEMALEWDMQQLIGYLNSWSSVQKYIVKNGSNPVDLIKKELLELADNKTLNVSFPIFMKIGIIK